MTGNFLLGKLSGDRHAKLLCNLLSDQFPDDGKTINKLLTHITRSKQDRNEIIYWIADEAPSEEFIHFFESRLHKEEKIKLKTTDDIRRLAAELDQISDLIRRFGERAGEDILQAWRDRRNWQAYRALLASQPTSDQRETSEPPSPSNHHPKSDGRHFAKAGAAGRYS
jgi:hypothetical protein